MERSVIGKVGSGDGFVSGGSGSQPQYIQITVGKNGFQTLSTTTKPEEAASIEKIKTFITAYGMGASSIDSKGLTMLRTMEAEPRIVASLNSKEIKTPIILKIISVFTAAIKYLMGGVSSGAVLEIKERAFNQEFKGDFKEYNKLETQFSRAVEEIALPGIFTKAKALVSKSAAEDLKVTQGKIQKALNLLTPRKSDSPGVRAAKIHLGHTHKDAIAQLRKHFNPNVEFHAESEVIQADGKPKMVRTDFTSTAFVTQNVESGLSISDKMGRQEERQEMQMGMKEKYPELAQGKRAPDDVDSLRNQGISLKPPDDLVQVAKVQIQSLIGGEEKPTAPQLFLLELVEELVLDNIEDFIDKDTNLIDYEKCKQVVKEAIASRNEQTTEIAHSDFKEISARVFNPKTVEMKALKALEAFKKLQQEFSTGSWDAKAEPVRELTYTIVPEEDLPAMNSLVDAIFDNRGTMSLLQNIHRENETHTW